jgi:hypothetical protein
MLSSQTGEFILNILKQLQKAERELEKKAHQIGQELDRLRKAILALGYGRATKKRGKRRMSAATKRRISLSMRKNWATKKKA